MTFSKRNSNAYIYSVQKTGEDSLKLLTDLSDSIIIPYTFIPTQVPPMSLLVPSKYPMKDPRYIYSLTLSTESPMEKIIISRTILSHETIEFESFQSTSGIAIDPSKSLSDKTPRLQYEFTSMEHKKDPIYFPTYVPSVSLLTSTSVHPCAFPAQKSSSESSLEQKFFNLLIQVNLLLTNN